jgi:putative tryptophan/tyrosine transport system substrate-binding protein
MRRREFISLLGGAAAMPSLLWPLASKAQERVRRIGVLMNVVESDPGGQARLAVFVQRLKELGWIEGRNVRFDFRGGAGEGELYRQYATSWLRWRRTSSSPMPAPP